MKSLNVFYLFVLIFVLNWFNPIRSFSQTGDLQFMGANSIDFFINSLDKIENGHTLNNWLSFKVTFSGGTSKWDLYFKSEDPNLAGTGGNNLPNSVIKVTVNSVGTTYDNIFTNVSLDSSEQLLVERADAGSNIIISVSLKCEGKTDFIANSTDYYSGLIRFVLKENPIP